MKGIKLCIAGLFTACLLTGCKSSGLSVGDYKTNTLLVDKKGGVQSGLIETFDKDYYDKDELEQYLTDVVDEVNKERGKDSMELVSLKISKGKARAVISYQDMDSYSDANNVEAAYLSLEDGEEYLPDVLKSLDGNEVTKEELMQDDAADKMQMIVLNEEYDVMAPGAILYYAEGSVINDSLVHTNQDVTSVIIFK